MKCEVDIGGSILQIDAVERFLCKEEDYNSISIDRLGFLFALPEDHILSISKVLGKEGGIIIGEGDVGKTVYQKMLREQAKNKGVETLILLRECRNNFQLLNDLVKSAVDESRNKECDCYIFVDGIDENPDSVYTIGSIWRTYSFDTKIHIWITSRQRDEVDLLLKECSTIQRYRLLPLRRLDATAILARVGIEENVIAKCAQNGLSAFLSRPSTCLAIADLLVRNVDVGDDVRRMFEEMAINLCEQRRDGRVILPDGIHSDFSVPQILECASWIATGLMLGHKHGVWVGAKARQPNDCLHIYDFVGGKYDWSLVRETINSRLFEPMTNYYIRLSYACLSDYLSALWLGKTVSHDNMLSLLSIEKGKCPTIYLSVAEWLNTIRPATFTNELLDDCPELFLHSQECITAVGVDILFDKLRNRYCSMSPYDRMRTINPRLWSLNCGELAPKVRSMLLADSSTDDRFMFAVDIIAATGLVDVQSDILEYALDRRHPIELRKRTVKLMWQLGDKFSPEDTYKLLKLFDEDAIKTDTEFRGYLLSVLWPRFLRVDEILNELVPTNGAYSGRYAEFVAYQFVGGLPDRLSKDETLALLGWSAQNIYHRSSVDAISKAAALVFSICWKDISDDDVLEAALKCYYEYCRQSHRYELPFASDDECKYAKVSPIDRIAFEANQDMRFRVLERIIDDEVINAFYLPLLDAVRSVRYPLYSSKDFNRLYDQAVKGIGHVERWARCLAAEVWSCELDNICDKLAILHQKFPDINEFSEDFIRSEKQKFLHDEELRKYKEQREEQAGKESFEKMINHFRGELEQKKGKELGDVFLLLCHWFPSSVGAQSIPVLDITTTPGWSALDEEIRIKCVVAAKELLSNCVRVPRHNRLDGYEEACALRLVIDKDIDWIRRGMIDSTLGAVLTLILTHSQHVSKDMKISVMMDEFANKYPEITRQAVLRVVKAEYEKSASVVLDYWGGRLSPFLVGDILRYLQGAELNDADLPRILRVLCEHGFRSEVDNFILNNLQIGTAKWIDGRHDRFLLFVMAYYPDMFEESVMALIRDNPRQLNEWLLRVLVAGGKSELVLALKAMPREMLIKFCIWLEKMHPAETRVKIPSGCFTPTAEHELVFFMNDVNWMLARGDRDDAIEVAEQVNSTLGDDSWKHVVDGAKYALSVKRIMSPPISIKELIRYLDSDIADRLRVYSSSDLLRALIKMLLKYDTEYLHSETSAITDLWNEIPEHLKMGYGVIPKYEGDLSNHISRYLKLAAPEFTIDREVLVTPRLYKNSEQDAGYVDLKVQAQDLAHHIQPGIVHIEVKCNWNGEVATNLETQLYRKYILQTPNSCGIFLCGCFSSPSWHKGDYRRNKIVKGYETVESAKESLQKQILQLPQSEISKIETIAIDCSMT